jgi:hypothetical protein
LLQRDFPGLGSVTVRYQLRVAIWSSDHEPENMRATPPTITR